VRLRRVLIAVVALLALGGLVAGLVTGVFGTLVRQGLSTTGLRRADGASTSPAGTSGGPPPATSPATVSSPVPAVLRPVLAPAPADPGPDPARLRAAVNGVDRMGVKDHFSGEVVDVGTGTLLYSHAGRTGFIPASTTKLLTCTAALSLLGPSHEFVTTVVSGGPGRVVLVGGGDPYLARKPTPGRASLADLAAKTAAALAPSGERKITLGYDASLFRGPAWNPLWPASYRDQVGKVSALWADEGRVNGGGSRRVSDPAADAAQAFAAALKARGIAVSNVQAGRAAANAAPIAAVSSMPLERIVEALLMVSDNDAAEVVLRQAALAARQPATFDGGRAAVRARLGALGVLDPGVRLYDGSGLTRQTRIPADTMVKVIRLALAEAHPELRPVATGLPVAGVEGSLHDDFTDPATRYGRGLVRGKTGTLTGVHSLAGYLRTADGSLLAYAFLVNNAKNEYEAVAWLQRVTTALARCGCGRG
jgi:D-alanyl-D-alanine carboxypeptidase/D-alanyl-D-alanine-endopeptidase (penicillin-binding protein 4)